MNDRAPAHSQRLLWAGFFAILAAGMGFAIRGGILGDWAKEFGFTMSELGQITGGGLVGFGIIIMLGAAIADAVGYGKLMVFAFVMHVLSAAITLAAAPIYKATGDKDHAYWCLYVGMFLFAVGNGTAEAVVNPLVATLFPKNKTHYLNILHAGWPGGLILGGLVAYFLAGKTPWELPMALFLLPCAIYGLLMWKQGFPASEASSAGVGFGEMLAEFASPILLLLLVIHAMVGYVELGTDSWIANITGSIMSIDDPDADKKRGLLLLVYTSGLMFVLRFFAGPIVHRISPLGLLCTSAVLAAVGLRFLSSAEGVAVCVAAATIYGIGKTFFWPTMLGVVSERFPRGGALTLGAIGGIGMLSGGLLGGPGIGYTQDYHASRELAEKAPETSRRYASDTHNRFLIFPEISGLDGSKVAVLKDNGKELARAGEILAQSGERDPAHERLGTWWSGAKFHAPQDKKQVDQAGLLGGRMALKVTAYVPTAMAALYLLLILIFRAKGGYRQVHVAEAPS